MCVECVRVCVCVESVCGVRVTCALLMSGRCVLLLGNCPNANHLGEAQLIAVCLVTVWKALCHGNT